MDLRRRINYMQGPCFYLLSDKLSGEKIVIDFYG